MTKFSSFEGRSASWKEIEPKALEMRNMPVYRRVQGQDLWAREAKFHQRCLNEFTIEYGALKKKEQSETNSNTASTQLFSSRPEAHHQVLEQVANHIKEHVIEGMEILEMNSLLQLYVDHLEKCGFSASNYKSSRLRTHIENHAIGGSVCFTKSDVKGCVSTILVYNSALTISDAVQFAFKFRSRDQTKAFALQIQKSILKAFEESPHLPWPPTSEDLGSTPLIPDRLKRFLSVVIGETDNIDYSDKLNRLVYSIGQDLCRAATKSKWKLPKHILLASTLRHLYRSKKLTTIFNRLGHCESYKFSLDLDSTLAQALDEASDLLTPQIAVGENNEVFHMEWDNMNQFTTNVHGTNVVNSTGGIMIQELKPGAKPSQERLLPTYDRSKRPPKQFLTEKVPPFQLYGRVGPKFPTNSIYEHPKSNDNILNISLKKYHIWVLLRVIGCSGKNQTVPAFGGFASQTGETPLRKSTIDYFVPINEPFTDYAVIKELLSRSEKATDAVGQHYVLNTFDLGGCMKALPIVWKFPDQYKRHVITPGPFHIAMNYLGMLTWNKCRGSGYAEILVEAKLAEGSLTNILKGKAYAKSIFAIKTVSEALQRLLIEKFIEEEGVDIQNPSCLFQLMQKCNSNNLDAVLEDNATDDVIKAYCAYEEKVRKNHLGKTAAFWMSFIDHCRLVLML